MSDPARELEADGRQHRLTSRRALIAGAGCLAFSGALSGALRPAAALVENASGSAARPTMGLDAVLLEQTLERARALPNRSSTVVGRNRAVLGAK